jgi:nucleoside-diphosphate-sugar epimerase
MKVLLTGATGFIGAHVARALVGDGHEVHALVRAGSDPTRLADLKQTLHIVEGDLLSGQLPPLNCPLCIHLAWYVEPGKYLESPLNTRWVEISLQLARAAEQAGCKRFLAAGTCLEYAVSEQPLNESSPAGPRSLYAESKLALFHALQSLVMEIAWTRFFYQYGPRENARRLVPHIIRALLQRQPVKLTPGEQVRDFLHVEDVASAVVAVANSHLTGAVNIGSGKGTAVRDLAWKLGDILGQRELIEPGAVPYSPNDPMYLVADNTKLRSTGWKPRYDLDAGLRRTIEWWRTRA